MEEGLHIVHREQRGVAGSRFIEVTYVDDHRTMIHAFGVDILRQDIIHPCARTFACTREIVGVEDAYQRTVGFGYFEDFYLFVINRHVLQFLELYAIQFSCYTERTLAYVVQLEVWLDLLFIQCIFGFAQFLGIEPPVPGLEFLTRVVLFQQLLQSCRLTFGSLQGRCPNGCEESIYGLMVLCHAVRQDIVRRVVITEQFSFLDTQLHLTQDDRFVIIGVVMVAACGIIHEELLAQVAVLAVLQHRRERRTLRREEPLTRMTGCGCFFGCSGFGALRQTL